MKLGIIQSRGLGDIIIALPIADYYREQGWDIVWPVCAQWQEQLTAVAPWVKWLAVTPDQGSFFYDQPLKLLQEESCDEILPLYQALTGHPEFTAHACFQHTKFDQYKYIVAGVPFKRKWQLAECLTRNLEREQELKSQVLAQYLTSPDQPYVVTHLASSEQTVTFDPAIIPDDWAVIPITEQGWLFDWISTVESAEAVIMTDSSMANLVDQLELPPEKYFIPQHHIGLTPVFGSAWHWLENTKLKPTAKIFRT